MSDNKTTFTLDQPDYCLRPDEIARQLATNLQTGLSKQEAERRHGIVGNNALESEGGVRIWRVFIRQVANALTLVRPYQIRRLISGSPHGYGFILWNHGLH